MKIRTRLTLWYAAILIISLLLIGFGTYQELAEQMRHEHRGQPAEHALGEAGEMIFLIGLPAVLLGLIGGLWLTRRALAPVTKLTEAVEGINDRNLRERLPRTCNGDELDRLTEVFNAMTARLDGSFQRIREFTLRASHELKTPLTVLHGELENALAEPSLTETQRERFSSQFDEIQRLGQIVDGLTLLSKADSGLIDLKLEPLQLAEIVQDVMADAQILGRPANISVQLGGCEPVLVLGDRHRLRQLLLILADNAIKYNLGGGSVEMVLRRNGANAELRVINTGNGIPSEKLPNVFEPFYRGDSSHNRETDGCGLGLSIAQWIVSAHKGTIRIESIPSEKTTVTLTLPTFTGEAMVS